MTERPLNKLPRINTACEYDGRPYTIAAVNKGNNKQDGSKAARSKGNAAAQPQLIYIFPDGQDSRHSKWVDLQDPKLSFAAKVDSPLPYAANGTFAKTTAKTRKRKAGALEETDPGSSAMIKTGSSKGAAPKIQLKRIATVHFGWHDIDCWYDSPYPIEEFLAQRIDDKPKVSIYAENSDEDDRGYSSNAIDERSSSESIGSQEDKRPARLRKKRRKTKTAKVLENDTFVQPDVTKTNGLKRKSGPKSKRSKPATQEMAASTTEMQLADDAIPRAPQRKAENAVTDPSASADPEDELHSEEEIAKELVTITARRSSAEHPNSFTVPNSQSPEALRYELDDALTEKLAKMENPAISNAAIQNGDVTIDTIPNSQSSQTLIEGGPPNQPSLSEAVLPSQTAQHAKLSTATESKTALRQSTRVRELKTTVSYFVPADLEPEFLEDAPESLSDLVSANGRPRSGNSRAKGHVKARVGSSRADSERPLNLHTEQKLYVCDGCMKYTTFERDFGLHRSICEMTHPPGRKVYECGSQRIWEVDGAVETEYCRRLTLFGKLFIDHKYVFYNVEDFVFYIVTDGLPQKDFIHGFFSKEKRSLDNYNLACIIILPPFQSQSWAALLIEMSYELSRRSQRPEAGTPERPLSDLGLAGYTHFWVGLIVRHLVDIFRHQGIELNVIKAIDPEPTYKEQKRKRKEKLQASLSVETPAEDALSVTTASEFQTQSMADLQEIRPNEKEWATQFSVFSIAQACAIRPDDAGHALEACGLADRILSENGAAFLEIAITPNRVREVAEKWKIKRKILDPACLWIE